MTRIGIVGIGGWGRNLLRTFDTLATVEMACHTGSEDSAAWLDEHHPSIPRTTELEEVLEHPDIDAVVIATPIPTLSAITERALDAGKAVFVEKPMAQDADTAEALAARADDRDQLVFVGYLFVHHPLMSEAVASDAIDHLQLEWTKLGAFGPDLLENLACHPIAVAIDALGVPETIEVTEAQFVTGDLDTIGLTFGYPDASCTIRVDRVSPDKRYLARVYDRDRGAVIATDERLYAFDADRTAFEEHRIGDTDPLTAECQRFLDAVEGKKPPRTTARFGRDVLEVLDRIDTRLEEPA